MLSRQYLQMAESECKPSRLSALYVNTGEMRCDHSGCGGDTNRTHIYLQEWILEQSCRRVSTREEKKKNVCMWLLSSYLSPFLTDVSSPSLCPHFGKQGRGRGGDSIWTSNPLHRLWETAWLRARKKLREREGEKGGRDCERCLPCTRRCNPSQEQAQCSTNGSSRTSRRMEGFHGYPQPSLLISLSSLYFPLLCLGRNVKWLTNTAAWGSSKWPPRLVSLSWFIHVGTNSRRSHIHTGMFCKVDNTFG